MAISIQSLLKRQDILEHMAKQSQAHVTKHPFRLDAITIELYLHPTELQATLCLLALHLGRTAMYKEGPGASYRLAWYEEGQYHALSFGYSNVKNFITDESVWGDDPKMLIPVRLFYNPNKATYFDTLRSKKDLTDQEVLALLEFGILQTKTKHLPDANPTYLAKLLTYFSKCTAIRAMRLGDNEVYRPATIWKLVSGDIALDLPVASELVEANKNTKSSGKTHHIEIDDHGKYGYALIDGLLRQYTKNLLGVEQMAKSANRTLRNKDDGMTTNVVGMPLENIFGEFTQEDMSELIKALLNLAYAYPITRVEQSIKKLNQEITFDNGNMVRQNFNSIKGRCVDVRIADATDIHNKIDIVLDGASVMKTQVDRNIGELPPTNPNEMQDYLDREKLRKPVTETEIGNLHYLYSLPREQRELRMKRYSDSEKYTIRNMNTLLSMHKLNTYSQHTYNESKFRTGALNVLNDFSAGLTWAVGEVYRSDEFSKVLDALRYCMAYVDDKYGMKHELSTGKSNRGQLQITGMSTLNKCLEGIVEAVGPKSKDKYSKADLAEFVKQLEESDTYYE